MAEYRSTYDISARSIRPYVRPLWPGMLAPACASRDEDGRALSISDDHLTGRHVLLLLVGNPHADGAVSLLRSLARHEADFGKTDTAVMAVSASSDARFNRRLKQDARFPWHIVCDSSGGIFASYGLHKGTDRFTRLVLLTPYRQVRAWFDLEDADPPTLEKIMHVLDGAAAAGEHGWSVPHAPVLLVPNVLSPEECGKLVESVETGVPFMVRRPQPGEITGNYKIPVYEHDRQDRVDLLIKDANTLALLDERLFGRVTPMIKKAFAFDVTRREDLHVARYEGRREGFEIGHRDNTNAPGAHRKFALSMSLNEDYEGGGVAFKEFSQQGYRVPAGTAMVFSSSLLHEVQETTSGVRYNLISHLF